MKVYLVEEMDGNDKRILAVCVDEDSASMLAIEMSKMEPRHDFAVQERTLIYGQPTLGYNP